MKLMAETTSWDTFQFEFLSSDPRDLTRWNEFREVEVKTLKSK